MYKLLYIVDNIMFCHGTSVHYICYKKVRTHSYFQKQWLFLDHPETIDSFVPQSVQFYFLYKGVSINHFIILVPFVLYRVKHNRHWSNMDHAVEGQKQILCMYLFVC